MTPQSCRRSDFWIDRALPTRANAIEPTGTAPLPGWVGLLFTLLLLCFVLLMTVGLPFAEISHVVDSAASALDGPRESSGESSRERAGR